MRTRYFSFWCERCPTRITVETEAPPDDPSGGPEYSFAELNWVGLVQVRSPSPGDDGLEVADLCPSCAGQLRDLDDLLGRQIVPYHELKDSPRLHAEWLAKMK
jgi:hypothetical protein